MRVLFITNMFPVADYIYFGIHVKEQIESLQKYNDVDAEVFFINGRESKANYMDSVLKIRSKIQTGNFDLIHIHYGISGLFLLFFTPSIPVVITLHSGELYRKKGWINHILQKRLTMAVVKKVSKIVVLNDDMSRLLSVYKNKLAKIPCGTDLTIFKVSQVEKRSDKIVIGFPGNKARKEKNYLLFNEIVSTLRLSHEVEVIEFHNLSRNDVVRNLHRLDLLLMTSTVEGSPQIIKEAMAANKAIVSTSVGDVADLLKNVSNSHVLNSFNANDFIKPINDVIALPSDKRISNGRDKILAMGLDTKRVADSVYQLYQTVL
ncbi:glycosyltransferase [Dyadobacter psychrophilus]|nr:glycosyltransferase [Dyadobacter psychrophilus]